MADRPLRDQRADRPGGGGRGRGTWTAPSPPLVPPPLPRPPRDFRGHRRRLVDGAIAIYEELGGVWTQVADIPHPFPTGGQDAFGVNLVLVELLINAGMDELAAQAIAVAAATPVNFLGNKLWTFDR